MAVSELARLVNEMVRHGVSQRRAETVLPRLLDNVSIRDVRAAYRGQLQQAAENRKTIFQQFLRPKPVAVGIFGDRFRATVQFIGRNGRTGQLGVFYRTVTFPSRVSAHQAVQLAREALTQETEPGSDPLDFPLNEDEDPLGAAVVTYHQAAHADQII